MVGAAGQSRVSSASRRSTRRLGGRGWVVRPGRFSQRNMKKLLRRKTSGGSRRTPGAGAIPSIPLGPPRRRAPGTLFGSRWLLGGLEKGEKWSASLLIEK